MATKPKPSSKKVPKKNDAWESVEPTDAEDSGMGGGVVPENGYLVIVDKAYFRTSNSSKKEYVNLELQISEGEFEGRYVFSPFYIESESDNFRKGQKAFLAKFFEVCTGNVPDELPTTDEDLSELVGTECWVKVIIEPNQDAQGRDIEQNRVVRVRDPKDAEEDVRPRTKARADVDEDDDEPTPRKKKRAVEEEEEDDDPPPRKKKRAVEEEEEDDEPTPRKKKRAVEEEDDDAPPRKKKRAVVEEEEEEDDEEDEEEDDDPPPRSAKKKVATAKRSKRGAGAVDDMDDDIPI
jgi:hypothetical protein